MKWLYIVAWFLVGCNGHTCPPCEQNFDVDGSDEYGKQKNGANQTDDSIWIGLLASYGQSRVKLSDFIHKLKKGLYVMGFFLSF